MANVIDYILRVHDEITPSIKKIEKNLFNFSFLSQQKAAMKIFDTFKEAIGEAALFQKQMIEITKVLDESFVSNIDNVKQLKVELRAVSRTVPKTIDEIMSIAAEGAKMGVSGENIPGFTKGVAEVSRAFEVSSEEAANKFIKVLSAFGKDVSYESISYLGGEMNEIANNMKAKGRDLLYAMNLSTAALTNAGLNEKQVIALNATGLQVGLQPGVTGNALVKYASMMSKIQETKKGRWALHYLGFSQEQWDTMRRNPQLRNEEVLKRLSSLRAQGGKGDIEAQTRYQKTLDAMFGFYRGKDIDRIIAQLPEYYKALNLVSDETQVLTSLQTELEQVTASLNDKTLLLKNSFREFIGEIGEIFIPGLEKITEGATSIIQRATDGLRGLKDDKTPMLEKTSNYIDIIKAGAVTVGTYAAWAAGVTALGLTAPISGPILAGVGAATAVGTGVASYGYFRGQEKKQEDLFNLNETTNRISQMNQTQTPFSLKVEGGLKVPKGYEIQNLNFTPIQEPNKNFTAIGDY